VGGAPKDVPAAARGVAESSSCVPLKSMQAVSVNCVVVGAGVNSKCAKLKLPVWKARCADDSQAVLPLVRFRRFPQPKSATVPLLIVGLCRPSGL